MFILRPTVIRPSTRILAKKEDFIAPTEAPGEGNRRFPTWDERDETETKEVNRDEGGEPHQEVHHESFQDRGDRSWKVPKGKCMGYPPI